MIKTKAQLIKTLKKIGGQKIEQGVFYKELALSVEHYKEQKSLKEWLKLINYKILKGGKNG